VTLKCCCTRERVCSFIPVRFRTPSQAGIPQQCREAIWGPASNSCRWSAGPQDC